MIKGSRKPSSWEQSGKKGPKGGKPNKGKGKQTLKDAASVDEEMRPLNKRKRKALKAQKLSE